jgi:hypothetical protein
MVSRVPWWRSRFEDGGGDRGVLKDLAPVGDAAVGGEDDRAVLVAAGDDLEEARSALGGQGEVAEFSMIRSCGPFQKRIVVCQRPSRAARWVLAGRSALLRPQRGRDFASLTFSGVERAVGEGRPRPLGAAGPLWRPRQKT